MKTKSNLIRLLSVSAAVLLAASVCCSCQPSPDAPSNVSGKEEETVKDLGGYEFTWATIWNWANYPEPGATEYGDKRLARYEEIEKKYHCTIKNVTLNAVSFSNDLAAATAAGSKYYDFFELDYARFQTVASSLKPLNDLGGIDVNAQKFNQKVSSITTRDGKVYGLCYDYQRMPVGSLLFYNKSLLDANGLEDPYELVKSNNWTFAKFEEMCKKLTKGTDGGEINQWGLAGIDWNAQSIELPFIFANGGSIIKKNDQDKWTFALLDDNAQEALNYLNKWFYTDKTLISSSGRDMYAGFNKWLNGEVGFFIGSQDYLFSITGADSKIKEDMEWGFVPLPIGPSADGYRNMASDIYCWSMMNSNPDAEKAAIIFNAISEPVYDSYEEDKEAYFDDFTANRLQGEDKWLEMYNLCCDSVIADDSWGMQGAEILGEAIYSCTRNVSKTPKVAMETIANNMEYWIGAFFYGLTEEDMSS